MPKWFTWIVIIKRALVFAQLLSFKIEYGAACIHFTSKVEQHGFNYLSGNLIMYETQKHTVWIFIEPPIGICFVFKNKIHLQK